MKKRSITKRKALIACSKLWWELAKSGNDYKPKWANNYKSQCPCCDYNEKYNYKYCAKDCIIGSNIWPNGCQAPDSPYRNWQYNIFTHSRKKYARIIAEASDLALSKLPKLKRK